MTREKAYEFYLKNRKRLLKGVPYATGVVVKKKGNKWIVAVMVTKKVMTHTRIQQRRFDGVMLEVFPVGEIKAFAVDRTDKYRPANPGVSIGHFNITAGTFGAVVYKNGQRYILSNNHVLADCNKASLGDPIYQPGPADGGTSVDRIGTLYDYEPIIMGAGGLDTPNEIDAALCLPDNYYDLNDEIIDIGSVRSHRELFSTDLDIDVMKSGRTTEYTESYISQFYAGILTVAYNGTQIAYFENQIITPDMADGGDSGSLLVDKNTGEAIGLLFAGNSYITIFNRIDKVCDRFNIRFFGQACKVLKSFYDVHTVDAITYGAAAVVDGEAKRKWTEGVWRYIDSTIPVTDTDYGVMKLSSGDEVYSVVEDLSSSGNIITITHDKYGSTSGTFTVYIRGSSTLFAWDDALPSWQEYTDTLTKGWRYIQLKVVAD